ncbi:GldG family protein [Calothrix sp. 336/3]|uniref:GldG family protein n=1 Tax=Calothrix sp. 336/3 TaxID=1337936 RepID=UPI0004E432E8|nr:Gldg family protein [Calothrix sp. 336/3]AKG20526.1 ABC transporter [Calothrix sp. 336/3]
MKIIATQKPWKYLFLLGPFFTTAGFTIGFVSAQWNVIPLLLIILGVAISGFWLFCQNQTHNWWGKRSTQVNTNALIATLAFLAILALINFLGSRYYLRSDFTETRLFTLSPQSQELVRSLKNPVKVWIFDSNQNAIDKDLLENYQRLNPLFKYEYIDPKARPGIVNEFGMKEYGEVYIQADKKRQLVQVVNQNERLSEIRLTNRLQQVTNAATAKIYFLQGHGERPTTPGKAAMSQAIQSLSEKNFTTSSLNLAEQSNIPQDASVIVIAGAKRALLESEVIALREYLNQGGNLVVMVDPGTDPKLDSLLNEWGVKLDNRLVVDLSSRFDPPVPMVTEYGQHPITKDFGNGISYYPVARAVDTTPVPGIEAKPLLLTKGYPKVWAESDLQSENLQFNQGDRQGPFNLGVALKRQAGTKVTIPTPIPTPTPTPTPQTPKTTTTAKESRMVVFGNSSFATDGIFTQQLNGDIFLNSVTWTTQQDNLILSIRPKEARNRRINLSEAQANLLGITSLFVLPLLGFITAAFLWWQRR